METQTEKTTATKYVNNFTYLLHCINNKCTYQVIFLMQDIGTQPPDVFTRTRLRVYKSLFILNSTSQGHNLYKLQYISLEEVKIVSFQQ